MEPKSLEDLEKYITILIVDDDDDVRKMLSEAFKKAGYETVWAVETADEAYQYLEFTNILFADYSLPNGQNGIELAIEAKEKYGERIQTVIFSGELEYFDKIQAESKKAKVAACIPKPIQPTYLQLWIKELGKRIWMQQIINNDPDEVLIRSENGTILYVDKQKEIIFGNNLIGDKCYLRFEEGYPINQLCERCPSRWSFNECSELEKSSIVRTEWDYITRGDINKHKIHQKNQSVELVTAPLLDIQKKPRAIIEIARDITIRKTAENIIGNMEAESTWENRKKLFMDGFDKLGITRSRLYLYYEKDKRKIYRMIDNRGKYDPPIQLPVDFDFGSDEPTRLILSNKQPLVFRRDENNDNRPYEKDKAIHNLYWVGKNNINHYEEFHKQYYNEWIDIPLIAHENIIGKVTIDGWKTKDCPDNYDIAILGRYCKSAGQIMYNARVRRDIEQRRKTEEAILEISREITNLTNKDELLNTAARLACKTISTRDCSIFLYDKEKQLLIRSQSYGINILGEEINNFPEESFKPGNFITGYMFQKNKPAYKNNLKDFMNRVKRSEGDVRYKSLWPRLPIIKKYEHILGEELYNWIFAPLIVGNENIGLLRAMNKLGSNDFMEHDFNDQDLEMFKLLAGQIAVALHNAMLNEKFKILFDKSPDGIVIIDPNDPDGSWPIIDCNEEFCKMNGYKYKELLGSDINILNVNPLPREKYYKRLQNEIRITNEIIHKRQDETEFPVESLSSLIELNRRKYVLGIDRDITESKRLKDIAQTIASLTVLGDFEETLKKVVQGTIEKLGCDVVTLYAYNEAKKQLMHYPKYAGRLDFPNKILIKTTVALNSVVYKFLNYKSACIVPDTSRNNEFQPTRFTKEEGIKSLIVIPLKVKEQKVGVMFINYRSVHEFTEDELKNIKLFTDQTAVAICNAQLFEDSKKQRERLQVLGDIDRAILSNLSLSETLDVILRKGLALINKEHGEILLIDKKSQWLVVEKATIESEEGIKLDPDKSICGISVKQGKTVYLPSINKPQSKLSEFIEDWVYIPIEEERLIYVRPAWGEMKSELVVPLIALGKVLGVINVESTEDNDFSEDDRSLLKNLSDSAAIAILNAQRYKELEEANDRLIEIDNKVLGGMNDFIVDRFHELGNKLSAVRSDIVDVSKMKGNKISKKSKAMIKNAISRCDNFFELADQSENFLVHYVTAEKENLDLKKMIKKMITNFKPKPDNIKIKTNIESNLRRIRGNYIRMESMIREFINNSIDAMPNGGTIKITARNEEDSVLLIIEDNGSGIPEYIMRRLYNVGNSTKVDHKGLGLFGAYMTVKTHRGFIFCDSTSGNGTIFKMSFPGIV